VTSWILVLAKLTAEGNCDYAANLEKATSHVAAVEDLAPEGDGRPLAVHTPGQKTIEDVARFLGVSPRNKIKTLALVAEGRDPKTGKSRARGVVLLLRGDAHSAAQHGSNHTEPLHQNRIARCDSAMRQFSEALLCSTCAPNDGNKVKGSVQ
jgi:prolyl-tRNA synthetase